MAGVIPSDVAAIVVTRGDVDVADALDTLSFLGETLVWDNSIERADCSVFGRYAAIASVTLPVVLVQDDDVVLPRATIEALLAAYEPGEVTANVPARFRHAFYLDHCLVGFGAVFDRDLPGLAFDRWRAAARAGVIEYKAEEFERTCDVVFTTLTPYAMLDLPYFEREFASAPNRMWKQPGHVAERQKTLDLARRVRDAVS